VCQVSACYTTTRKIGDIRVVEACWYVWGKYGTQNPRTRARDASWESVGRSEVFAEGSGVVLQDCTSVAMSQALEDRVTTPRQRLSVPKMTKKLRRPGGG
jgi:hypothetical protein